MDYGFCVHNGPPLVPVLKLINPVHPFQSISSRSILIISSHSRLCLPGLLFPSGFPTKTLYAPLLSPIPATHPGHLILPVSITQIVFHEGCRSLSSSLYSFPHFPITSSLLGPNILLRTLFSNTLIISVS